MFFTGFFRRKKNNKDPVAIECFASFHPKLTLMLTTDMKKRMQPLNRKCDPKIGLE